MPNPSRLPSRQPSRQPSRDPLNWIDDESYEWKAQGLSRTLIARGAARSAWIESDGRRLINFASNDYLSLAADPRVIEAGCTAAQRFGWGSGGSPLVSGWRTSHHELCAALAAFEQTDAALLFPSGYLAGSSTVAALVSRGDAVYSDQLNHACLIDGARLSRADVHVYPHVNVNFLEDMMKSHESLYRRTLLITEGVFSMDGDVAPLADLADLAERYSAMLLVDEAHATGLLGPDGQGAAVGFGLAGRVAARVGTLSKALGSQGGYVVGSRRLIDWLTNHARAFMFSTSLPPAAAAAAGEALRISLAEPWRRAHVRALAAILRDRLRAIGFEATDANSSIVPVVIGDPVGTIKLADRIAAAGSLVAAIRPPTVPPGTSRLRISLQADHRLEDLEALINPLSSFLAERSTVDIPPYRHKRLI